MLLLAEALEQRRDMNLIGLVISGQRIHRNIYAHPECHLSLLLASRRVGYIGQARIVERPGGGEIV